MPRQNSEEEHNAIQAQYDRIQELVKKGILSREQCPEPKYWRWLILNPEELPEEFRHFIPLGEVRWP